jgi:transcriptional regulator with XRE-family HTH domain
MGDSLRNPFVFCHAHGAQILEFRWLAAPIASQERFGAGRRKPEEIFIPRQLFMDRWKGAQYRPFQPCGNEGFLTKFPQVSTGLSKANLERWFTCVNLPQRFSASILFNPLANAENEGQLALPCFHTENGESSSPLLVADYPQMNFTQMHERLRLELLRRIQRGTVSVSLLARQTGFGQSHLSNFLHSRRQLSLEALDRILAAQHMAAGDLLPANYQGQALPADGESSAVPVVSHAAALFEPYIRPSAMQSMLHLPAGLLQSIQGRPSNPRRAWQRFVAVRIPRADALAMEPLILPEAITLIDRHYNSLIPYRPNRPNLYAVRHGAHLTLRYVDFVASRLVLRPHNIAFPVDLLEVDSGEPPSELLAGRIALILNEP